MTSVYIGLLCFIAGLCLGALLIRAGPASFPRLATKDTPAPGELWVFMPDKKGPWPTDARRHKPVEVLDVREGWVRYAMGNVFPDERMSVKDFTWMYRKVR
jgi:hypothetical protein